MACACVCPVCGDNLVAKKGPVLDHHFAHEGTPSLVERVAPERSEETLLHQAAKQLIRRHRQMVLPELVEERQVLDGQGRRHTGRSRHLPPELVTFNAVDEEVRDQRDLPDLQPDIVAEVQGQRYIIEIAVTHRCDAVKTAKLSELKMPALEVDLASFRNVAWTLESLEELLIRGAEKKKWLFHPESAGFVEAALRQAAWRAARRDADEARRLEDEALQLERERAEAAARAAEAAARQAQLLREAELQRERLEAEREQARLIAAEREAARRREEEAEDRRLHAEAKAAAKAAREATAPQRRAAAAAKRELRERNAAVVAENVRKGNAWAESRQPLLQRLAQERQVLEAFLAPASVAAEKAKMAGEGPQSETWRELEARLALEWDRLPAHLNLPVLDEVAFTVDRRTWQAAFYDFFLHGSPAREMDDHPTTVQAWLTEMMGPFLRGIVSPDLRRDMWSSELQLVPDAGRAVRSYMQELVNLGHLGQFQDANSFKVLTGPAKGSWVYFSPHLR